MKTNSNEIPNWYVTAKQQKLKTHILARMMKHQGCCEWCQILNDAKRHLVKFCGIEKCSQIENIEPGD